MFHFPERDTPPEIWKAQPSFDAFVVTIPVSTGFEKA